MKQERDQTRLAAPTDASGERALWTAVLGQGVADALATRTGTGASSLSAADRDKARRWIASPSFRHVASLAGLDGEAAQERIAAIVGDPDAAFMASQWLRRAAEPRRRRDD